MRLGNDVLLADRRELLRGKKLGILAHQASLSSGGKHIVSLLTEEKKDWEVTTLFGPEHGLASEAQDMEPVESSLHKVTGLPLFSLYGKTARSLKPKKYMFKKVDALVIDLQDIGTRYYTYVWTAMLCLELCAEIKKPVILCDRPNPINGVTLEGDLVQKGFTSFVGLYPLPVRHGMTIGEIARFVNDSYDLNCDLTVVPMEGWERHWYWEETGIPWHDPSPNMRSPMEALLYPGMCLLEGTNISEGRGTETPFEIAGAPFIRPDEVLAELEIYRLPGVRFEAAEFKPKRQKWQGEICRGVRLTLTDRNTFRPYTTGIALLWVLHDLYEAKGFQWRVEPYEFIEDIPALDLLTGSTTVRQGIERHLPLAEILEWTGEPGETFLRQRSPYLIY